MPMIFVTPSAGARVRMPERASAVMPGTGDWVPYGVHYQRLLEAGDVVLADPQPPMPGSESSVPVSNTRAPSASSKEK